MPADLVASHGLGDQLHYLAVASGLLEHGDDVVHLGQRRAPDGLEVTVATRDAPGLLATLTALMVAHGMEVQAASAYTLAGPEGGGPLALDVFRVAVDPPDGDIAALWERFAESLGAALRGELDAGALVTRLGRPSPLGARVVPRVPTRVTVDNQASSRATVVEVQAADRFGLLHAVTRALASEGLDVSLCKAITEADRVVDVFYVRRRGSGAKVTDPEAVDALRRAVEAAVDERPRG